MATVSSFEACQTVADLLDWLGGITPHRVRIKPPIGKATEADLIQINDRKRGIFELFDGILVQKASCNYGSLLTVALTCSLRDFIVPRHLGLVSGPRGLLRLSPNLIRSSNVAFIAWDRIPGGRVPTEPIPAIAPTLAIEILFPDNTPAEMARKRREYFQAGVRLVWEVDPDCRTVAVFSGPEDSTTLQESAILDGGVVLPGFVLPLAALFGELDRSGNS